MVLVMLMVVLVLLVMVMVLMVLMVQPVCWVAGLQPMCWVFRYNLCAVWPVWAQLVCWVIWAQPVCLCLLLHLAQCLALCSIARAVWAYWCCVSLWVHLALAKLPELIRFPCQARLSKRPMISLFVVFCCNLLIWLINCNFCWVCDVQQTVQHVRFWVVLLVQFIVIPCMCSMCVNDLLFMIIIIEVIPGRGTS